MNRLFIDCEFNGFGGGLISLAVVAEDGRDWYGVMPDSLLSEPANMWVQANVMPVLWHFQPMSYPDRWAFNRSLHLFLEQFENPTIVADWYTDLVHFFQCFAGRDHTESVGYACRAELVLLDGYTSQFPHNALSDARAIRDALCAPQPHEAIK